jgi:hypothetical protein
MSKLFVKDIISPQKNMPAMLSLLVTIFLVMQFPAGAATYYSRASTAFNTAGTWSVNPSGTPVNGTPIANTDIFIIQSGNNVTVGAARTIAQVTINSGGTLTLGTFVLTISGSWTNNGTITGSTGRMTASTGTLTNNGTINFTGAGGIVKTTGTLTNAATGTITIVGAGTVTMGTGDFVNNNSGASVDFGSSVITITGTDAAQSIGGFVTDARFSCTKTAGTLTLTGNITCIGITMNGSGSILNLGAGLTHISTGTVILTAGTLNGGSSTLYVNVVSTTAWQGTASVFSPGTGTVNFGAAGNQTLSATGTRNFYNLSFSNSGTKTNATTAVSNTFSLEGTATASAVPSFGTLRYASTTRTAGTEWTNTFIASGGVIIDNGATVTINTAKIFNANIPLTINNGGALTTGANAVTFNGNFVNNGTWTSSTGPVTVTGTATQSIGDFTTTGLFTMSKSSGTATMTGNAVAGSFTLNGAGIVNLGTSLTHTIAGTFTRTAGTIEGNTSILNLDGTISGTGGSLTPGTGTVNLRAAIAQAVPNFIYYDLGISGASTKTLTGTTTVNHELNIASPGEFDLSSATLNLAGSGTPLINTGTFTPSASTVNYTGGGSTNITAVDYYNLNGTGGDRKLLTAGPIGIAGVFTPGAGAYDVTGSQVDFNGMGNQNIPAFSFNKLTVSTSGIKRIPAAVIVTCSAIDVTDSASIEINADGGGKLNIVQ